MKFPLCALAALLAAPASAQMKFVAPVVPMTPALGKLALPTPSLSPGLGSSLPVIPSLTPSMAAVPGSLSVPKIGRAVAVAAAEPARPPESFPSETAVSVAESSLHLAQRADSLAVERGLRVDLMTGAQFLAVVEDAARESTGAGAAAVNRSLVRVVRALLAPDAPLRPQMGRLLGVWQVFNQEMARVAEETGNVRAVVDEADLFARQVEASL